MKPFIIVISAMVFITSCTSGIKSVKDIRDDQLFSFFSQCENDLNRAAQIVEEKDIVKNLNHLHIMGHGGRKYYLLERESITSMINSVTRNIYSDYILISSKGTVLYTRNNNEIFGLNVRGAGLNTTPLFSCYSNHKSVHIVDARHLSITDADYSYFISKKVSGKDRFPGLLILQLNASLVSRAVDKRTQGLNNNGIIKLSWNKSKLNSLYNYAKYINFNPSKEDQGRIFTLSSPKHLQYRYFSYRNLSWVLVSEF